MPSLIITCEKGVWKAIPSQGIEYKFSGLTYEGRLAKVREYAGLMKQQNLQGYKDLFDGDLADDEIVNTCFKVNDQLMLDARTIYGTVGEEFLIDDLEMAGEALALVLT